MEPYIPQPWRILLVEEDPIYIAIAQETFAHESFTLICINTPLDALSYIKTHPLPHLIVTEYTFAQGMNGFEFCQAVHTLSDIPIIMYTEEARPKLMTQALDLFADDFLHKPYNPGLLLSRVRRVLKRISNFEYLLVPLSKESTGYTYF